MIWVSWAPSAALMFLVWYPVVLGMWWLFGALWSRVMKGSHEARSCGARPFVTVLVPAHDEQAILSHTLDHLLTRLTYDRYEVLVVDDGSTDETPHIVAELERRHPRLRALRVDDHRGKAHALNQGLRQARGDFVLVNDADTVPPADAIEGYLRHLTAPGCERVGAVTGSTRPQNTGTALSAAQDVEFGLVVDATLRCQAAVLDTIYSCNGANTMFRRSALTEVGGFREDRAAEDICATWDETAAGWRVDFAPEVRFRMNVAESLPDLFRQRVRWAQGDTEVWLTSLGRVLRTPSRSPLRSPGETVVLLDRTLNVLWSVGVCAVGVLFAADALARLLAWLTGEPQAAAASLVSALVLLAAFIGVQLAAAMVQVLAGVIAGRTWRRVVRAPLFALVFWPLNAVALVVSIPAGVRGVLGAGRGTWRSPERARPDASRAVRPAARRAGRGRTPSRPAVAGCWCVVLAFVAAGLGMPWTLGLLPGASSLPEVAAWAAPGVVSATAAALLVIAFGLGALTLIGALTVRRRHGARAVVRPTRRPAPGPGAQRVV